MTDGRNAMLAIAMNGVALPIEHGFPVRTVVPGLYGYVSACKWVVDMEVTRFDDISAYWTERGWGEKGPVKMSSRVDVPRSGAEVSAGEVELRRGRVGAAHRHRRAWSSRWTATTGGPPRSRRCPPTTPGCSGAAPPTSSEGDHVVRVRAIDKLGTVQTGVEADVLPDGATGWHASDFSAS